MGFLEADDISIQLAKEEEYAATFEIFGKAAAVECNNLDRSCIYE